MKKHKKLYALLLALVIIILVVSAFSKDDGEGFSGVLSDITEILTGSDESSAPDTYELEKTPAAPEQSDSGDTDLPEAEADAPESAAIDEDGTYTTKEDVALYIYTYGHLPSNFITKSEAKELGWPGGSLENYAPGKSIGGDYFGNYEGLLPKAKGRQWTECDINTAGASSRGAERIIFSNDGLIYYTGDHYESFELLYGQP